MFSGGKQHFKLQLSLMATIALIEDYASISQMYSIKFEAEGYMSGQEAPKGIRELGVSDFILQADMTLLQGAEVVKKLPGS
jgi:DNA-binding response OmpR family regulator